LDKKNVEAVLSPLRTTFDSYNDFIYKTAQRFMYKVFIKILIINAIKKDMTFGTSIIFSRLSVRGMLSLI
jgi:hypothetical protein